MSSTSEITDSGLRSYEYYTKNRQVTQSLGQNEFLSLLATQMQYQDPLEPTSDTDFIAQLATFTMLSQIESLTNTTSSSYAFSLAGKYVTADVTFADGSKSTITGVVDRTIYSDGKYYVQIGEYVVDVSAVTQVYDSDLFTGSNQLVDNANLIGKYVTGKAAVKSTSTNDDGETTTTTTYKDVSGYVTRVTIDDDGYLSAYLDSGEKIYIGNIVDIRNSAPPASETAPEVTESDTDTGEETDTGLGG